MTDKSQLGVLLHNIQRGLEKYDIKDLNKAIVEFIDGDDNDIKKRRQQINLTLSIVCDKYNLRKGVLMTKNVRHNAREAKEMSFCLLHFELGLKIRYIANEVFHCWPNTVMNGIRRFKNLDPENIKPDAELKQTYEYLQQRLAQRLITIE